MTGGNEQCDGLATYSTFLQAFCHLFHDSFVRSPWYLYRTVRMAHICMVTKPARYRTVCIIHRAPFPSYQSDDTHVEAESN
jgi:hypothetical protein